MSDISQNQDQHYNDEITLYDLYSSLMQKKFILISAMGAALLAAAIYLFITPPVYEASVRLYPPGPEAVTVTIPDYPGADQDVAAIFLGFQTYVHAGSTWRKFLQANAEVLSGDTQRKGSRRPGEFPVSIATRKNKEAEYVDVAYRNEDPVAAAELLDKYLQFSATLFAGDYLERLKSDLKRKQANALADIAIMRESARMAREDQVEKLRANLDIAKALSITDGVFLNRSKGDAGNTMVVIVNNKYPDYLRGTRALSAEIEALVKRESDDPYIEGLRERQVDLVTLSNLDFSADGFKPYSQSSEIAVPAEPKTPDKARILIMSAVLGGVLGLLLVILLRRRDVN